MSGLLTKDLDYKQWVQSLSKKFRQSQIKAAVKVNREMLAFYWELGRDIVEMKAESRWGSGFMEALSQDLQRELPGVKGLSSTNLRYIKRFYLLYSHLIQAQAVPELVTTEICAQVVPELSYEELFSIPWGHHRNIIIKCQDDTKKAIFYIKKTIENGWSRAVLLNFLDTDLYERQGKAVTNFASTLPGVYFVAIEMKLSGGVHLSVPDFHCIGFRPSIDENCTHLILGSMPSVASLGARQYYAHPQNRFWPLMAGILEKSPPSADYQDRLAMLLRHHIALWDSIAVCERKGSLDADIKNEQGNDFTALLDAHPHIHTICFNGGKSYQCFKKYNKPLLSRPDIHFHQLPSTSPANARWNMEKLTEAWKIPFLP